MSKEKLSLKELIDIATNEEPSNALMQELVLLAFDAGKIKQIQAQSDELKQFKNPKNWTRSYDCNGDLLNKHGLYLPYV